MTRLTVVLLLCLTFRSVVAGPGPRTVILVPISKEYLSLESTIPAQNGRSQIELTPPERGVRFDLDGDGVRELVSWTQPNADVAFLGIDFDGDGRIGDGRELVGSRMRSDSSSGADALHNLLREVDSVSRGAVQGGDRLYDRLLLWVDRDHNGVCETSELRLAKELFTRVGLGFRIVTLLDKHGNIFWLQGWTELRTEGPDQGPSNNPRDHAKRLRQDFEVVLKSRD